MPALRIIDVVSLFYQRSFTVDAAMKAFGPAAPRSTPGTIDLVPQDPELRAVWLELSQAAPPEPSPFLAGLALVPQRPSEAWFDELKRPFGRPERLPPLYPAGDTTARFEIRGFEHNGYVLLRLDDDKTIVGQAILRRFRAPSLEPPPQVR